MLFRSDWDEVGRGTTTSNGLDMDPGHLLGRGMSRSKIARWEGDRGLGMEGVNRCR